MTYKCCDHCELLAEEAWKKRRLRIEDWYATSSLATGEEEDNNGYKAKKLKDMKQIIAEGRGRKILKKRGRLSNGNT
jgi:hypothetical protein